MKAFPPKEARPHTSTSPSSTRVPSSGFLKTHNKDNATSRLYSKPGRTGQGASNSGTGQPKKKDANVKHQLYTEPASPSSSAFTATTAPSESYESTTVTSTTTKIKKPKTPKPSLDPNEHISQRAFIGGLSRDVTLSDVEGRFRSFGQIKDIYVAKDVDGMCRGFGYVTLETTRKEWQKCVALFNGAKWKGNVMKIEEAKKNWETRPLGLLEQKYTDIHAVPSVRPNLGRDLFRRQEDLDVQAKLEKKEQEILLKKLKKNPVRHADDMSLITEKNVDGKRGWKRGRYGRPIITMKLDRMTYDPSHYKSNLEKLFNVTGMPLPLDKLIYRINEDEPIPKGKHLPTEVVLAQFLSKSKSTIRLNTAGTDAAQKSITEGRKELFSTIKAITAQSRATYSQEQQVRDSPDDRAMMASILAQIDMSPRASPQDGSDIDDDEEGGTYMEDLDDVHDTKADELFGDVLDNPSKVLSKSERDSRPEDLFGDDENGLWASQPSLSFLEEDGGDGSEGDEYGEDEYEDEDEEMESADEEVDDDENEGSIDEDTIEAIAQLQNTSSTSTSGLFDSDDDNNQDAKSSAHAKLAGESNAARLKAMEARQSELEVARGKQQQLIASKLVNIDLRDKKAGHVVFSDSDDYDSEDYEKMEANHVKKMASLNNPAKNIFDSDSGSDDEQQPTLSVSKKTGIKEIFGSDDEDDNTGTSKLAAHVDLNIKEQFEGPGGKALFKMQTKIGTTDSRFQLSKDFLDDRIREEDDADYVAHQDRLKGEQAASMGISGIVLDEDRQGESDISAEKMQAMNILRAMFGDSVVRSKKKEEDTARQAKGGLGFTTGLTVRYDPAVEPPSQPLTQPATATEISKMNVSDSDSNTEPEPSKYHSDKEENQEEDYEQDEDKGAESIGKGTEPTKKSVRFSFAFDTVALNSDDRDEDNMAESTSTESSTATKKDVDNTVKFQVASDLKSLFAPATGTFKLFGDDDDENKENDQTDDVEDDRQIGALDEDRSQDEIITSYTDGARTIFTSGTDALNRAPLSHSGSLFFFHFKNPSLLKRSNFKTDNKVFMRTSTMDEVTVHWEKTRRAMTQEFKRKHKSAARNKARASKRLKTTGGGGPDDQV
ncbi:hypothetical protein BGZ65_005694 [Modicella reniformis]|uniref:RRM domain-containing protein n=1 Tax=Modicella reniformis TaxID=1440133 RepID=A0A9P6SV35_9FUNG|nr:hypothetical protein BGZ65_005694 [Modicella reniformis]